MDTFKGFKKPIKVKSSPQDKLLKKWAKAKTRYEEAKATGKLNRLWKNTRTKPVNKVLKKKRTKLPTTRKLILIADKNFSLYVRQRDKSCVLCGSTSNLTNGHLLKRSKKTTRFSESNCNCLCSGCNYKDNFEHDHYVLWWINKYGLKAYTELIELSKQFHKWTREELLSIIDKYKDVPLQ